MGELKHSIKADQIVNLYRSALYMAQGSVDTSLNFLKKAITNQFGHLNKEMLTTEKQQKYWAEKILDQYIQLRNQIV